MTAVTAPTEWEGQLHSSGWRAAHGGTVDVLEKATGERLATVGLADATDVAEAAERAAAGPARVGGHVVRGAGGDPAPRRGPARGARRRT